MFEPLAAYARGAGNKISLNLLLTMILVPRCPYCFGILATGLVFVCDQQYYLWGALIMSASYCTFTCTHTRHPHSRTHTHTHTQRLLVFLERVIQHSETSKMDLMNVSMVIAPNLFVALPSRQSLDDVLMAAKTSHVVRLLIKYRKLLWTVSAPTSVAWCSVYQKFRPDS